MKKIIFILLFFSTSIFCNGILKSSGGKIIDSTGKEIIFKGIGLGGWLVPEGYMFNMQGFANSPTEIKNKIIEVVGKENAELFFDEFRDNFVSEADIDSIASWGFNMIRLPMHFELLTPRDSAFVYSEKGFKIIDDLLLWCKKNDLYLILDLHAAPGGQGTGNICDYIPGEPSLWESEENKARTIDLWREIASRYAYDETIAGYDLLNEPHWDLGPQNTPLRELYIDITNAIRTVDTNHIVYIEGNWYATNFDGLTPPWDENLSYSFHKYWSEVNTGSIQSYLTIRNNYNTPLWMSESGENSNSWFKDFVSLLEENSIGWTWWTHKKFEAISSLSTSKISPQFQQLLNYWNGNATKPSEDFAMAALLTQIENIKIGNCKTNEDVIDALMRRPYDDTLIPFADNTIPGIIYGVNFDYGNLGKAFYDATPANYGAGSYNNGWAYRNEGVDIEECSDQITNGYSVGWIESGEWLKFTCEIQNEGTYDIKFRVSANTSEGKLLLQLDNEYITNVIDIPATGGWYNWQTLQVHDIYLPQGIHELVIRFIFTGFNFNYMEFIPISVDVERDLRTPIENELKQNYPNPFNPSTLISYSLNKTSHVKLKIYDAIGNEIKTLIDHKQAKGNYELEFDASNISSGIYFYKIEATAKDGTSYFSDIKKMIILK